MSNGLTCEGLIVEMGPSSLSEDEAFEAALASVAEAIPGSWGVEPLGGHDFLVTRWDERMIPVGRSWELAARLAGDRRVRSAEPALRGMGLEPESPADLAPQERRATRSGPSRDEPCAAAPSWSLDLMRAEAAWALDPPRGGRRYGSGVVVGHPDTGYSRHPEIFDDGRVLPERGYDFEDDDDDPKDPLDGRFSGHGTATASVIMSDHDPDDDEAWVSGIAPRAKLIPLRVSDSVIHFRFANVIKALDLARSGGAHVVSMSLGGVFPSRALSRAVDRAIDAGVIVLSAAGNVWPWVVYPARYAPVIAVAAVNCRKQPWSRSARGDAVDVSAPGESVWRASADREGRSPRFEIGPSSGTSYAVASAAGACACWLAFHGRRALVSRYGAPNLAAVFREVLLEHGVERPRGWDAENYGAGIVRLDRLLAAPLPDGPPGAGLERSMRRGPATRPDPFAELAELVPGLGRAALRRGLADVLRTDPDELDGLLEAHGDELVVQLATDPVFRGAILGAGPGGRRSRGSTRRRRGRRMGRPNQLSPTLQRKIGLRR